MARRPRLHYLDWLRVLAVLGVFVYHTLQPFSTHAWHVKNAQRSGAIDAVVSFVDPWGVAFFFLIAGASTFLALRHRTAGEYVRERLLRLLVPLAIAYVLLSPVQAFIEETFLGRYSGTLIAGLPLFFKDVYANLHETLLHPLLVDRSYHLWFVIFLLWFALLGLPLFLWLRAPGRRRLVDWVGARAHVRGVTLLFGVPFILPALAVLPVFPAPEDWGTFVYLLGFFVAGHVLMSDGRLMHAIGRDAWVALGTALALDVVILAAGVPQLIEWLLVGVQAWAWTQFLLGVGLRARRFQRPLPGSVSAAAMPFFLVHQPVILAIAFFVVRWDTGIAAKWAVIALSALLVSALVATALARAPLLSTLFGVKRTSDHELDDTGRGRRRALSISGGRVRVGGEGGRGAARRI